MDASRISSLKTSIAALNTYNTTILEPAYSNTSMTGVLDKYNILIGNCDDEYRTVVNLADSALDWTAKIPVEFKLQ